MNELLMLNVGYAEHDGDWNFEKINSPFTRIYLVTDGEAEVEIKGMRHSLTEGHLYIIPAFTEHSDISSGVFNHYYVHFYEDAGLGRDIVGEFDFPFEIPATEIDGHLFKILCENNRPMALKCSDPKIYDNNNSLIECVRQNRNRPLYSRLESMGIIFKLLSRFIKIAHPKFESSDKRILQSLNHISENQSKVIRVDELADLSCMSIDHFIRLFKQEVGCTPAQFLIEKKMMKAKLMLASESVPIKDIAYSLGYDDVSYFTRMFKKHSGLTPLKYRNSFNPA